MGQSFGESKPLLAGAFLVTVNSFVDVSYLILMKFLKKGSFNICKLLLREQGWAVGVLVTPRASVFDEK